MGIFLALKVFPVQAVTTHTVQFLKKADIRSIPQEFNEPIRNKYYEENKIFLPSN